MLWKRFLIPELVVVNLRPSFYYISPFFTKLKYGIHIPLFYYISLVL